jgi:hypothetical protein
MNARRWLPPLAATLVAGGLAPVASAQTGETELTQAFLSVMRDGDRTYVVDYQGERTFIREL